MPPRRVTFPTKKMAPEQKNAYYLESGLLGANKSLFFWLFDIEDNTSMPKSRFN